MKVSGIGSARGPSETRRTGKTSTAGKGSFAGHLASAIDESENPAPVESLAPIGRIETLLAVQDMDGTLEQEQRQRLTSYGETLLDQLEDVRRGLIFGAIPFERLTGLARMVRERREQAADPRLAAILSEIELRVEVEMAKLARHSIATPSISDHKTPLL
ncbi:MAG: flagellar assembly protein FliX [Rhodospirillaceae bacterium]|nr:flagellar assembly protein FliX [Rhodospirillaceae bacterium]